MELPLQAARFTASGYQLHTGSSIAQNFHSAVWCVVPRPLCQCLWGRPRKTVCGSPSVPVLRELSPAGSRIIRALLDLFSPFMLRKAGEWGWESHPYSPLFCSSYILLQTCSAVLKLAQSLLQWLKLVSSISHNFPNAADVNHVGRISTLVKYLPLRNAVSM